MTDELQRALKTVLGDIMDTSPAVADEPVHATVRPGPTGRRRQPSLAVAAAVFVLLGAAGTIAILTRGPGPAPRSDVARADGSITNPIAIDFGPWTHGAPPWPLGQPADYLVPDVSTLEGWNRTYEGGGHLIGEAASYYWNVSIESSDGRRADVSISSPSIARSSDPGSELDGANDQPVEIQGRPGLANDDDSQVSWLIDQDHSALVTEYGAPDATGALNIAQQLATRTVDKLVSFPAPAYSDSASAVTYTNAANGFAGSVDGVSWSVTGDEHEVHYSVGGAELDSTEADVAQRRERQGITVTENADNEKCVFLNGYLPDTQSVVELVLSDSMRISLPTRPLADGESWFAACVPYRLDAIAVEIAGPGTLQPLRRELNAPYFQPTIGLRDGRAD